MPKTAEAGYVLTNIQRSIDAANAAETREHNRVKRMRQLRSYVSEERAKLGYGSYPPIETNKPTIDILTNVLAYLFLIEEGD